ncbi:DUF3114 domain-containing protein [Streptococcus phocae subsp. phocae]
MKTIGKTLGFLLVICFLFSFIKQEHARITFETNHKDYQDFVSLFYQYHPKATSLNLSDTFELRNNILIYSRKLAHDGWSYQAIEKGYLKHVTSYQTAKGFHVRYQQLQQIGSDAFNDMWRLQEPPQNGLEAEKTLSLLLNYLHMPTDLTGDIKQIKPILKQFSSSLAPADPFWDQLASLVQMYYTSTNPLSYTTFSRQLHQLRYVLATQQAQWVRDHYGNTGKLNDAKALAKYLATLEETDYSLNESSRYHNKVATRTKADGNLQAIYPDQLPQTNYKVLVHFHSEFILSESGHFLLALDPCSQNLNGIINGASFNYSNQNDDLHKHLDVDPIDLYEPDFIEKTITNPQQEFKTPDLKQQADHADPIFSRNNKSLKQLTKSAVKTFKKLLDHYRGDFKTEEP